MSCEEVDVVKPYLTGGAVVRVDRLGCMCLDESSGIALVIGLSSVWSGVKLRGDDSEGLSSEWMKGLFWSSLGI